MDEMKKKRRNTGEIIEKHYLSSLMVKILNILRRLAPRACDITKENRNWINLGLSS
jgi:hypothetical protein